MGFSKKGIQYFVKDRPYVGTTTEVAKQHLAMTMFGYTDEAVGLNAIFYLFRERQNRFKTYNIALQRMMHNMAWSLGYQEDDTDAIDLANTGELLQMVLATASVLTLKEIQDIIANPIEPTFLRQAQAQQEGIGYSARRRQNELALYGKKATNPYYFFTAPVAWTFDLIVENGRHIGLFRPAKKSNKQEEPAATNTLTMNNAHTD